MGKKNGQTEDLDLDDAELDDDVVEHEEIIEDEDEDTKIAAKKGSDKEDDDDEEVDYKKLSIRDTIKDAFKASEKEDKEEDKKPKKVDKEKKEKVSTVKASENENSEEEAVTEETDEEDTIETPPSWAKKKDVWKTLSPEAKKFVAQREKEVSTGFAKYGEDTKKLKELDAVLAPRREAIQRFGASEAQTVDRLFQWMEALSGQNPQFPPAKAILQLAKGYGIDLSNVVPQAQDEPSEEEEEIGTQIPDEVIESKLAPLKEQINAFIQQQEQARINEAQQTINAWAANKPHFEKVRPTMHQLLSSGVIPLKNGVLDFDTAYERAILFHPDIQAEVEEEQKELLAAKKAEEAKKKEAERIIKLNKAKKAGASLKSAAPIGGSATNKNLNGKNLSVRDSIKQAMHEISNSD